MTRPGTGDGLGATLSTANHFVELAIAAVSYFGVAAGALLLPALNAIATPLWPPTGVALSIVLLRGHRIWPAIGVGSLSAAALSANTTIFEAAAAAMATTLAALAGAWLINRWSDGRKTFASARSIAAYSGPVSQISAMNVACS